MKISLNTSNTSKLNLKSELNTDVSAFHFKVSGLPIKSIVCHDTNKIVDYNNEHIVVYGMNKLNVMNGDLLTIEFDLPNNYGTYNVALTPLDATTGLAERRTVEKGSDGIIAITFSQADLVEAVSTVVTRITTGLDINYDGLCDIIDVQLIANNLG
jgi:hypothetical protein